MAAGLDGTLAALADPTRRRVIDMLRERPRRAGELASAFDLSPPAMSRHLRVLRTRGLIEAERTDDDARLRIFRLRPEPFGELRDWLEEVERFWGRQLDSFRSRAETKRGESDR